MIKVALFIRASCYNVCQLLCHFKHATYPSMKPIQSYPDFHHYVST